MAVKIVVGFSRIWSDLVGFSPIWSDLLGYGWSSEPGIWALIK